MKDEFARNEALNVSESFIVQAPAGSGKTTLLISRFMCLLAIAEQPEEVLAITFTRAATAEMRDRICRVLDPNNQEIFPQETANRAVETVRQRSQEEGWNLLEQPSRLQIVTIDALCTGLIRRMPWASRFGSLPGITDNPNSVYEAAVLNLYESANENIEAQTALKTLLQHLDNNSEKLQQLLVQLLTKRDQWLRLMVQNSFSDEDREEVEKLWRNLIAIQLNKVHDRMPDEACVKLGLARVDSADPETLTLWKDLIDCLLTKSGTWRKLIRNSETLAILSKEEVKDIIHLCKDIPDLDAQLNEVRTYFPAPVYHKNQWKVLNACSVVLQYAVAQLKLQFRKIGQVDFIEMAQQAVRALGHVDAPTDLSLVLDYQYRHIMVDEFQDTSVSQRELLELLTGGWQRNDGRTLFLVGDPMQSIYRFREAEVGIYLSVIESGLGNLKPKPLRLTENFRSSRKLVEWFNKVFTPSFPSKSELETGSVEYVECTTDKKPSENSRIKLWVHSTKSEMGSTIDSNVRKKIESKELFNDLKEFQEQNQGTDAKAAILVRSRAHASEIISRLTEAGIQFYAADFAPLNERPIVQDLLSLTRALLNLADRTSWAAILRAPWCGLTLNDLLVICEDENTLIWDRLNEDRVVCELSKDGRQRVQRVREVLRRTLSVRGRVDLRQWIHDCWLLLGGPACVAVHDNENAELFFDLVEHNTKGSGVENLNRFEEQLESLFAVPEANPNDVWLHITTIHKAKGLEYDAVFLPRFSTGRVGFPSNPLLIWSEFILEKYGNRMLMSPIVNYAADTTDSMYGFLKHWDGKRQQIELMRLAYVACTRAKSELYIYAEWSRSELTTFTALEYAPPKNSLLNLMWPGIVASKFAHLDWHQSESRLIARETEPPDLTYPITRLPAKWRLPDPPPSVAMPDREFESPGVSQSIDFDWAGSVALWVGNVVHEWLEKIVRSGVDSWNQKRIAGERSKWRTRLLAMGMSADKGLMDDALARIETALSNVLQDPKGQWILRNDHKESDAELRLTGYVNGQFKNIILDRTFVDDNGIRWVIDYKSGTTSGNEEEFLKQEIERYRDQLENYRTIVSGFEKRPIKTGLYFPMFPAWREVG